MRAQYFLGVHLPAAWIGGIVLLGWGLVSTYIVGYTIFFTALGIAFRPIWRQERLETKPQLLVTEAKQIVADDAKDYYPGEQLNRQE